MEIYIDDKSNILIGNPRKYSCRLQRILDNLVLAK